MGSYKYLKWEKSTNGKLKKKKEKEKKNVATIATMPLEQTKVAL